MTASGGEVGRLSIVGGAEVRRFCFGTTLFELRKANYLYQAISCVRAEQFIWQASSFMCLGPKSDFIFWNKKSADLPSAMPYVYKVNTE